MFNPDLLLKDELIFELKVRNIECSGDVSSLRKKVRVALKENREENIKNLTNLNLIDELDLCNKKVYELNATVESLEPPISSNVFNRVLNRIEHLSRRVFYDHSLATKEPNEEVKDNFKTLNSLVKSLLETILTLRVETPPQSLIPKMAELALEPNTVPAPQKADPVVTQENVVLLGSPGNVLTSASHQPTFQQSSVYAKLKNPMEHLLKDFPQADGLNVSVLLAFLKRLLKIVCFSSFSNVQVLEMIFPFTSGPLAERTALALANNFSFSKYHADILSFFVPSRLFTQLKQELFHRLQHDNEPLANYVLEVKEAANLLLLRLSEKEIVDVILDGLHPTERSRFVFTARPNTFSDLDQLCVQSQNVRYADLLRSGNSIGHSYSTPSIPMKHSSTTPVKAYRPQIQQGSDTNRGQIKCYQCGRMGHIKRNCRQSPRIYPDPKNV
jgi:hypothetical protein